MIKIPYGLADFYRIIRDRYLYLDRTAYIRVIEEMGEDALLLIRPRRFGKSLWLQTLRCYYDVGLAGEFDQLFGRLAVGRDPTPLHNRYFVLVWNFSKVDAAGSVREIGAALREHVHLRARALVEAHPDRLAVSLAYDDSPEATMEKLLMGVRKTPYKLYLLIDEYDNFVNDVMARDPSLYQGLVQADGPFKQVFKSVKAALEGEGLEQVFITGVSPVAMTDITSGFNKATDVYRLPQFNALCGFTQAELEDVVDRMVHDGGLSREKAGAALEVMHTWYDGYVFARHADQPVYNPTNCFYLLNYLQRQNDWPVKLYDLNLRMDEEKLLYLTRTAGEEVMSELARERGEIEVATLEERFSLQQMLQGIEDDPLFVAAYLYYVGLLTELGETDLGDLRLGIPNLVVRKLYLDQMLRRLLPARSDQHLAGKAVKSFFRDGKLSPLLAMVEEKLLASLSNRDHRWMRELTLKTLFMTLLFDDAKYAVFSELELAGGHPDLTFLRRPGTGDLEICDLIFEFKYLSLEEVGKSGDELRAMGEAELRSLPGVEAALTAATDQLRGYRRAFGAQFGQTQRLRSYAVVGLGLRRLLGQAVA